MSEYNHKDIEKKWQERWEQSGMYTATENSKKKKFFGLIEFPFASGDGLHVGHIRSNTAMDIICRKRRAEGFEVLYPIGWDSFGLPTENYAIKTGRNPKEVTKENTDTFRRQLKALGFSFDWSREIDTTDPAYYKWTQWLFLQFYKHGLAYKKKMAINWCPKDLIGLANEEVVDGCCERCGTKVEKREKEQWMLAITKYADRLDKDLDTVDFLPRIKIQQRNWIGRSEGAEISFKLEARSSELEASVVVFTTRPDTLFGATYLVLAPEHSFVTNNLQHTTNKEEILQYIKKTQKKTEEDRTEVSKNKMGVELKGISAINPANNEKIPVWIADYVLGHYGTGAIMAVPAHDERDFEFANKYLLPIISVVSTEGILVDSGNFSGMSFDEAKKKITESVGGKMVTTYKLRDWIFSRQRYWGEPIPMVHCPSCAKASEGKENADWIPVPEKDLPVTLPEVKNYKPTETGESPLASISEWVNTTCPKCGEKAKRETDTMPNWAGSSWYYLRYTDPKNKEQFVSPEKLAHWCDPELKAKSSPTSPRLQGTSKLEAGPVDWYNGGMEHTTLHLLYSRFWHKFLYDLKLVPTSEPYQKRTSHGLILAKGGVKMSKSIGNVINPDSIVETVGADTLRIYEMFMGPFDQAIAWDTDSIAGSRRFVERVWKLQNKLTINNPASHKAMQDKQQTTDQKSKETETLLHKTIKKVGEDIEAMKFNTAISAMMIFVSELEKAESIATKTYATLLQLLAPFAPHFTEELWEMLGNKESISTAPWPAHDPKKLVSDTVTLAVQINGKMRATFVADRSISEDEAKKTALALPESIKWLEGKEPKKVIYIKEKIVSIVV